MQKTRNNIVKLAKKFTDTIGKNANRNIKKKMIK